MLETSRCLALHLPHRKFEMPDIIRVRFATNRNPVSGSDLFGPNFRDNNPKRYVNGSIEVTRRSNLPDSGWVPDPTTLEVGPPIDALRFQPDEKGRNDIVSFARDRAAAGLVMDRAARLSAVPRKNRHRPLPTLFVSSSPFSPR